ncbi:MAG: rhodanese-like domain-containing protein [Patescibacteria group bacterium]
MNFKLLIILLLIIGGLGVLWSVSSFFSSKGNDKLVQNQENFERAINAELPDKCQTPVGYTNDEWLGHMSHHPDRYQECLQEVDLDAIARKDIGSQDLALMLEQKDFVLIDTHIPEQKHIPGTDVFISFNEITDQLSQLPQDKNAKIVLYCRSGNMSERASQDLIELGYTNVYNLVGGTNAWQQAGYLVEDVSL